uniref:1-phosphatidylinositol 3-phosphate 5-kinase n=1 Tax=Anthurium amnicola TaxID=1678845 RepID=A0A1D1Z538_9ARAE
MGICSRSFVDLIQAKVRYWIAYLPRLVSGDCWMFGVGDHVVCYGCRSGLAAPTHGHRCSQLFCAKCMQRTVGVVKLDSCSGIATEDRKGQPKFCKSCFQAFGRELVPMEYDERTDLSFSPRRFQLPHLPEVQRSSPHSLRCSTARSDEEDEEDIGKHFWSPCSMFSQDVSDVDSGSFSTGNESYYFKSLASSPGDSPNRAYGHGERSRTPHKPDLLEQESLDTFRTSEGVAGHRIEHTCTNVNSSIYHSCEGEETPMSLDIENNETIWFPPPPEDEGDDVETRCFEYDDDDEDVDHSGMFFPSSSFGDDAFPVKDKGNDTHRVLLTASMHGHFRALVSQLLQGEGIHAGNDDGEEGWVEVVSSLAWQAGNFVKPDTSRGGSMDPGDYVKVKCILSGSPRDSTVVKGVVCTKNVKHKRMISQHRNARLLLLGGSLEYQKVTNKLASIETILQQEIDHLKMAVAKIEARKPNVLLVEKSVSSYAQEYLLAKEISLVLNVKRPLLERISRCTGAQIAPSVDNVASTRLGNCQTFRVERTTEECLFGNQSNKKSSRTLMFFEGCPSRLGCTILLRGTCREELKKVKHILQYASFAAYRLSLERSFLADSGATLPKSHPVEISDTVAYVSDPTLMMSDAANNRHPENEEELQGANSSCINRTTRHLPCLDVFSSHCSALCLKNEREEVESPDDYQNSSPPWAGTSASSQERGISSVVSAPHLDLSVDINYRYPYEDMRGRVDFSRDACRDEFEMLGTMLENGATLKNPWQLGAVHEGRIAGLCVGNDVPVSGDYFSTSENQQNLLVSLSSRCVMKSTVCERSKLLRIKFYGNFDKPLGRYLCDDLFDQRSCCRCCKEPPEAHVKCFTHQQGSLTISVKRLSSMKLPGEQDGRIWMWHRCLKCTRKDGVPPPTRRVIMSDPAWRLSFGLGVWLHSFVILQLIFSLFGYHHLCYNLLVNPSKNGSEERQQRSLVKWIFSMERCLTCFMALNKRLLVLCMSHQKQACVISLLSLKIC